MRYVSKGWRGGGGGGVNREGAMLVGSLGQGIVSSRGGRVGPNIST